MVKRKISRANLVKRLNEIIKEQEPRGLPEATELILSYVDDPEILNLFETIKRQTLSDFDSRPRFVEGF